LVSVSGGYAAHDLSAVDSRGRRRGIERVDRGVHEIGYGASEALTAEPQAVGDGIREPFRRYAQRLFP
jgi:hypothetical protein